VGWYITQLSSSTSWSYWILTMKSFHTLDLCCSLVGMNSYFVWVSPRLENVLYWTNTNDSNQSIFVPPPASCTAGSIIRGRGYKPALYATVHSFVYFISSAFESHKLRLHRLLFASWEVGIKIKHTCSWFDIRHDRQTKTTRDRFRSRVLTLSRWVAGSR
jgi:hypothetical protein